MKQARAVSLWGYCAQLCGAPLSVILLPLLLWHFSSERIALWYLILTLGYLGGIAEQALEPALTRYLTYARNGIDALPGYGEIPAAAQGTPNSALVALTLGAAHWLYSRLSLINLLVFGIAGSFYLGWIANNAALGGEALRAWGLFTLAQFVGCRLFANIGILQGLGHTTDAFKALTVQRLSFLGTAILGLLWHPSLEIVGLAQLLSVLLGLGLAARLARHHLPPVDLPTSATELRASANALLHGSTRLWASRVGAFLIVKSTLMMTSAFLGLPLAGSLALTMQLLETITQLAQTPLLTRLPTYYELKTLGQHGALKASIGNALLLAWLSYCAGAAGLLWLGDDLLQLMGSHHTLLPTWPLALLLFTGLLEMNHSLSATLLLLENRVPFLKASLISGMVILGLSTLVLVTTPWGLPGALAVPFFVQLAYNNWKWPLEALRAFDTNYPELVKAGLSWKP